METSELIVLAHHLSDLNHLKGERTAQRQTFPSVNFDEKAFSVTQYVSPYLCKIYLLI